MKRRCCCTCKSNLEDVSVHGIHQLIHSESKTMKFFWLFVLFASVSLLIFEVYQIVEHYRSYPKATRVTWVTNDQYDYPDLAFCTKRWPSLEKIRRMNLSTNALKFLVSLVEYDISVDYDYSESLAQLELLDVMEKFHVNNYVDMLKAIAFDGKAILKVYLVTFSNFQSHGDN